MLIYSAICPICTQTRKELPSLSEFQQELMGTSRPATLRNGFFRGEVSGYFTDLVTYGQVRTDIGTIKLT